MPSNFAYRGSRYHLTGDYFQAQSTTYKSRRVRSRWLLENCMPCNEKELVSTVPPRDIDYKTHEVYMRHDAAEVGTEGIDLHSGR